MRIPKKHQSVRNSTIPILVIQSTSIICLEIVLKIDSPHSLFEHFVHFSHSSFGENYENYENHIKSTTIDYK